MADHHDPLSPRAIMAGLFVGLTVTIAGGLALHFLTREKPAAPSLSSQPPEALPSATPSATSTRPPEARLSPPSSATESTKTTATRSDRKGKANPFGADLEAVMNNAMAADYGDKYRVLTDDHSGLSDYELENFVNPHRKRFKFYPYMTIGDFDGDRISDVAAMVRNVENNYERLAVLWGADERLAFYETQLCSALSFLPANEWKSHWEKLSIRLPADAMMIECYEKSAWMLYWDGRSFQKYWLSD